MTTFPECYGGMFPDLRRLQQNQPAEGKAFTALAVDRGLGLESRKLEMNREECERCGVCPRYQTCYDFSLAKLLINAELMKATQVNPWVGG